MKITDLTKKLHETDYEKLVLSEYDLRVKISAFEECLLRQWKAAKIYSDGLQNDDSVKEAHAWQQAETLEEILTAFREIFRKDCKPTIDILL